MSSGEIRVFVESHCRFIDALDRAREIFTRLQMYRTKHRNGVLVYVAMKDHQFAILGDEGIHQKVGDDFWRKQGIEMRNAFRKNAFVDGIAKCVREIGVSLQAHFPYESDDEDELSNDIVFGK